jgi:hypothetical protein
MTHLCLQNAADAATISAFQFTSYDVLANPLDKTRRRADILKALSLESLYASKIELWVQGVYSCMRVRGRIMATGDKRIHMDNGLCIPLHSIYKVHFN